MFNYITAGESHGPQLTGIIEGIPAGLHLDIEKVNTALRSRQGGYGRGGRQKIEHDEVQIVGGVRHGVTLGSPIALVIKNRDHANWAEIMDPVAEATPENSVRKVEHPRPGHADLVGGIKYHHHDLRNVLERSSARETAIRVAIGNICEQLLAELGIKVIGFVKQVGSIKAKPFSSQKVTAIEKEITKNDMRVTDQEVVDKIHALIDQTKKDGDTLGGVIRVIAENVPAGLGSYVNWDTKFDGQLAGAVMGINAMKGVSFGDGFANTLKPGSQVMDQIDYSKEKGFTRLSNHLGGFEGGMTTGMPIVLNAAMKPIPTLYKPLQTVDINTKEKLKANIERSDTTPIVAASIVVENVVAIELTKKILETFESANLDRLKDEVERYREDFINY